MTDGQKYFLERLNALSSGDRAALRREAGSMISEAEGNALVAFYKCLPSYVSKQEEAKWYAVATLQCLFDPSTIEGKPLETILSDMVKHGDLTDSGVHRIENLMDTRWDNDGYMLTKLSRLIKLIRQKTDRQMVDFSSLLNDLIYWNADSQSVQRKWAKAIFSLDNVATEDSTEKE